MQQKLCEKLRRWREQVANFDKGYLTENGHFYLDCSQIQNTVLPRLNELLDDLFNFIARQLSEISTNFCSEVLQAVKVIKQYNFMIV